ncbi:MAG: hypothetical protein HC857_14870 [Synechococcales cyanobacterium RU_4_20]|nr:hypothetical protein [Synechococcales cyanobacterium RU_4_20]
MPAVGGNPGIAVFTHTTPSAIDSSAQLDFDSIRLPDGVQSGNKFRSGNKLRFGNGLALPHPHPSAPEKPQQQSHQQYHPAEVYLSAAAVGKLEICIDEAIKQFLRLSPSDPHLQALPSLANPLHSGSGPLQDQQRRLADKLRERLGYLGIYYKRDPRLFLRNLQPEEVAEVLSSLKLQYKGIVLSYFTENGSANATIDEFVNAVFFSDISVTKIVEIHMELMDEFSKQLKLEGRGEEILVDYRLTLLDIVAHLCEMYRRSIPRES